MGCAMSPLDALAPDQRAVVALVLQQGRSYDEIAALLGIAPDAVRGRARAGLAALAGDDGLPAEVAGPIADYLLGQQSADDAAATRGLLAESAPARAWAGAAAGRLGDVAPAGLPEIPAGPDASAARDEPAALDAAGPGPVAPRPRPVRDEPAPARDDGAAAPPASRLGGMLLIAGVVAVVAVVLFLVLRGGDDEPVAATPAASATPAATPTPSATPRIADRIALRSPSGGKAKGQMTVYLQDGQLLFGLVATDVPPNTADTAYAVWFTGPGDRAVRLGFTNPVGSDGQLGIQGPSDDDKAAFPKQFATYDRVVVSEETTQDSDRPGKVVLAGRLPRGR
jgi:Sigma-70, region 4/Anti-sigma-K factor rskA, C-terminal